MQFNSETNNLDLVSEAESLLGEITISASSNEYTLKKFARDCNSASREIWTWIYDSYGGWQYEDSNQTDNPIATDSLTADKKDYAFPAGTEIIKHIEIKMNGGSTWQKLLPITLEQIIERGQSESEFYRVSSTPVYYRLMGENIRLYPASNYTQSASFRVHIDRGIVEFANDDTTQTPGFSTLFHRYVAVGASLIHAKGKKLVDRINILQPEWDRGQLMIRDYYQKRFNEQFPPQITMGAGDPMREFT